MAYTIKRYHGSYSISRRTQPVRYIVVHYTGSGTSAPGTARKNCQYFAGGNRNSSAHYFIDDGYIYEYADPDRYYTWHCGDGKGRYGITNSNSIGIEVCRNGNQPYTAAELDRLHWLVRQLMERYDVPESRVMRHYDASRKACPYYYTPYGSGGNSAWRALHAYITTPEEDTVTDADIERIAQLAADKVVNYELNGVLLRNRIIGTDIAANTASKQLTRTDDPTGRGIEMDLYTHVKWLAATVQSANDKLAELLEMTGHGQTD